ncbi:MAG: hypothetical protein ACOCQ5_02475 [Halanaerobiales bacterium]
MSKKKVTTRDNRSKFHLNFKLLESNWIALILKMIGSGILILSIWTGFFCYATSNILLYILKNNLPFSPKILVLIITLLGLLIGLLIIGFGEIIQKLHEIGQKIEY